MGNPEVSVGVLVPLEEVRGAISIEEALGAIPIVARRGAVSGEWSVAAEETGGRGAVKTTFPRCVPPWPLPKRVLGVAR